MFANSKGQSIVAKSACESEIIAQDDGGSEAIGILKLYNELLVDRFKNFRIQLFTDSKSSIQIFQSHKSLTQHIRHIDRRLNWLKDEIKNGRIEMRFISTENQTADILTKALDKIKFGLFADQILGYEMINDKADP